MSRAGIAGGLHCADAGRTRSRKSNEAGWSTGAVTSSGGRGSGRGTVSQFSNPRCRRTVGATQHTVHPTAVNWRAAFLRLTSPRDSILRNGEDAQRPGYARRRLRHRLASPGRGQARHAAQDDQGCQGPPHAEPRPGPGPVAANLPLPPAVRRRWQGPSGPAQGYSAHLELASYGSSIC